MPAVDKVSLSINAETPDTLLGPSGSGKTTTLRMIAGFEPLTHGTTQFGGREMMPLTTVSI